MKLSELPQRVHVLVPDKPAAGIAEWRAFDDIHRARSEADDMAQELSCPVYVIPCDVSVKLGEIRRLRVGQRPRKHARGRR
jgi:hypothetical protein